MDVRFDVDAAERLLDEMDSYCSVIEREAKTLIYTDPQNYWDDYQTKAFQANLLEIANDLNDILKLEGEYMRTYYERIQDLKE